MEQTNQNIIPLMLVVGELETNRVNSFRQSCTFILRPTIEPVVLSLLLICSATHHRKLVVVVVVVVVAAGFVSRQQQGFW